MAKLVFKEGNKLLFQDKKTAISYSCSITKVKGLTLIISKPFNMKKGVLDFKKGDVIDFQFRTESATYSFTSTIEDRFKKSLYKITVPATIKRKQNREFFRLDCCFNIEYIITDYPADKSDESTNNSDQDINALITEGTDIEAEYKRYSEKADSDVNIVHKANTLDMSGGGLQFVSTQPLNKDKLLLIRIYMPGVNDLILIKGKIVRHYPEPEISSNKYNIAVIFVDIEEISRSIIIKYIFDYQRKLAKESLER